MVQSPNMKKHGWIIALFVALLLLIIYYAYDVYFASNQKVPPVLPATAVEAVKVIASDVPDHIHATGSLRANQRVNIIPEYSGVIAKIMFMDGQYVTAGQPLIKFEDVDAIAQLQSAKAKLQLAKGKYARAQSLAKRKAISQQNFDEASADYVQQQALVDEKQNLLDKRTLRAPFAGQVTSRRVDIGQYITAGQILVDVVDNTQLKVSYQIAEQQAPLLKIGQQVTLSTSAYPHQIFSGKVEYISPILNTQTRTVEVLATIPNTQSLLKPGMFVEIDQLLSVRPNMPIIPIKALVATLGGHYVYRIIDNKAVQTKVEVGQRWRANAEILSGLAVGQEIVVAGQQKLRDGMSVEITKQDNIALPDGLQ